ncbi:hypothetical protein D3C86_1483070 [compost metagenome]
MHHEVDETLRLRAGSRIAGDCLGVEPRWVDVHAIAGADDVDDHQAQCQRESGQDLEIDQSPDADATELLHVLHPCNAEHHGGEDDWCEHHLDQLDEDVAHRLEVAGDVGCEETEGRTGEHADEHLDVQLSEEAAHDLSPGGCGGTSSPLRHLAAASG